MIPQWIIERKRDGQELTADEIHWFIEGYTRGEIPDYQAAALAMAVFFKDMTFEETASLTEAMLNSGRQVNLSSLSMPKADKHSTGGVGDKVSLALAPLAASCGIAVPMISGRGLGITGGTLDKLESIPGYRTSLDESEFRHVVEKCGCSIIGQTEDIAPADRKLYALRDVTGTVPSIPLITASILSKKLAEDLDCLVMDVKRGSGAFMKNDDSAKRLAKAIASVGERMGKKVSALITDMNQPLGRTAGNAIEVREAIDLLAGAGPSDLAEVTLGLTCEMLVLSGIENDPSLAMNILRDSIQSGRALQKLEEMIELHGGEPAIVSNPALLPSAAISRDIVAQANGYVKMVDADKIGRACVILGAGRLKTSDNVDHAVGIANIRKVGEEVAKGERLATILANDEPKLGTAESLAKEAFLLVPEPVHASELIIDRIN